VLPKEFRNETAQCESSCGTRRAGHGRGSSLTLANTDDSLSTETRVRLEALFRKEEQDAAAKLLVEECGDRLPLTNRANDAFWDRVRLAVLKLSSGDLQKLKREIEAAKRDWRDTLVAAGFGHSVTAHESWFPDQQ